MTTPRTKIEIIDHSSEDNFLVKPRHIYIDGQEVCVEEGSLDIEYSDPNEPVRVHLTILPDEVSFKRVNRPEPIL